MATKIKVLNFGTLGTSEQAVYGPVALGKAVLVKNMRFVNSSGNTNNVTVMIKHSGDSSGYYVLPSSTSMGPNVMNSYSFEIALEYNDMLEAFANVAGTVEYFLSGIERDA